MCMQDVCLRGCILLLVLGCVGGVVADDGRQIQAGSEDSVPTVIGETVGWLMFTHAGKADFKNAESESGESSANGTEISLILPLPVYESDLWECYAGPQLDWYRYEFDHVQGLDDVDVYDVVAQLGATYKGVKDWEFLLSLAPGFYTDFRKTGREDFKTFAYGMATWQCAPRVQLVGGVSYDTAFGDDDVYPLGGVRWDPSSTLSLQLIFPEPVVIWQPMQKLALFAHVLPAGGKWNTYDKTPDHQRYSFTTAGWRTGGGLEVQLTEMCWFHLAVGMEFDRNYEIENDDGDSMMNSDVDDTWYTRVGVVIR